MSFLLSHLVDDVAQNAPDQVAFRVPKRSMTYAQLASRSNQLARWLCRNGVQPGDRVGIRMPRGLASVEAVFGILKAGGIYVPIAPDAPPGVAGRILDDCGVSVLLVHGFGKRGVADWISRHPTVTRVVGTHVEGPIHSSPWSDVNDEDTSPFQVPRLASDCAYILYSSGSTGRPKGIAHSHRSGRAYAELVVRTYGLTADDRIGSHAPLHFDMATLGLFAGPLSGCTVVVIPDAHTKMPASLSDLIAKEAITVWYSVPLALSQLVERGALEERNVDALRWVLYAGEPFPVDALRALMRHWSHATFSNVYGPTEVNQCTFFHLPAPPAEEQRSVPIGQAWENTEIRVVDEDGRPVASGEIGELWVRTETMMLGYWERADLNAHAFVHEPDSSGQTRRFYRTGDLMRLRADGVLEFEGRKDRQVKIRGHRIELGSIERTLERHPLIREAVLIVRRNGDVSELHAVVRPSSATFELADLYPFLNDELLPNSRPTSIRALEEFPRTSTGKIDRKALESLA